MFASNIDSGCCDTIFLAPDEFISTEPLPMVITLTDCCFCVPYFSISIVCYFDCAQFESNFGTNESSSLPYEEISFDQLTNLYPIPEESYYQEFNHAQYSLVDFFETVPNDYQLCDDTTVADSNGRAPGLSFDATSCSSSSSSSSPYQPPTTQPPATNSPVPPATNSPVPPATISPSPPATFTSDGFRVPDPVSPAPKRLKTKVTHMRSSFRVKNGKAVLL